jgi:hypothetical protein
MSPSAVHLPSKASRTASTRRCSSRTPQTPAFRYASVILTLPPVRSAAPR